MKGLQTDEPLDEIKGNHEKTSTHSCDMGSFLFNS